jgi:hypothetical protein
MINKLFFILILGISFSLAANEKIQATTASGQKVLLYSNGTWAFKSEPIRPVNKASPPRLQSPPPTLPPKKKIINKPFLKGKNNAYKIIYNDRLWTKSSTANKDADSQLVHKKGHGYAMVIFDRTPISLEALKQQVLTNMRSVVSEVEIISEEKKQVNGHQMMILRINSAIESVPFSYINYYASGKWGTVQFVTYTATVLMAEYEADFITLLNGLTIK